MFPDSRFGPLVWERSLLARHNDEFLQDFIDRRGLLAEKKAKKVYRRRAYGVFHSPPRKNQISIRTDMDVMPPPPQRVLSKGAKVDLEDEMKLFGKKWSPSLLYPLLGPS